MAGTGICTLLPDTLYDAAAPATAGVCLAYLHTIKLACPGLPYCIKNMQRPHTVSGSPHAGRSRQHSKPLLHACRGAQQHGVRPPAQTLNSEALRSRR